MISNEISIFTIKVSTQLIIIPIKEYHLPFIPTPLPYRISENCWPLRFIIITPYSKTFFENAHASVPTPPPLTPLQLKTETVWSMHYNPFISANNQNIRFRHYFKLKMVEKKKKKKLSAGKHQPRNEISVTILKYFSPWNWIPTNSCMLFSMLEIKFQWV